MTANVIKTGGKTRPARGGWGVRLTLPDWTFDLRPAPLTARVGDAVLAATRDAIRAGRNVETGARQNRGYDTGRFARTILRTEVEARGARARCEIAARVVGRHNYPAFVSQEEKRGYEYFGWPGRVVDEELERWLEEVTAGRRVKANEGEREAAEV